MGSHLSVTSSGVRHLQSLSVCFDRECGDLSDRPTPTGGGRGVLGDGEGRVPGRGAGPLRRGTGRVSVVHPNPGRGNYRHSFVDTISVILSFSEFYMR